MFSAQIIKMNSAPTDNSVHIYDSYDSHVFSQEYVIWKIQQL